MSELASALTLWRLQEKGKGEAKSFLGVGAILKDESQRGYSVLVDTVEEAIKHWTQIWVDAAEYEDDISSNVQVRGLEQDFMVVIA